MRGSGPTRSPKRHGTFSICLLALLLCLPPGQMRADTRIVAIADTRGETAAAYTNTNALNTVVARILELDPPPAIVTVAGDMVVDLGNVDGDYTQFTNCMQPLVETGIPYYVSVGNHDTWGSPTWYDTWQASFDYPSNGPAGWEEKVYYLDVGAARVIALDSASSMYKIGQVQRDWLRSVAGTNSPAAFDIVVSHMPAYPASTAHQSDCLAAYPADRDALVQALVDVRASLYLCGHEHFFARRMVDTRYHANWTYTVPHIYNCDGAQFHLFNAITPLPEASERAYSFTVIDLDDTTRSGWARTYADDGSTLLDAVTLRGKIYAAFQTPCAVVSETNASPGLEVVLNAASDVATLVSYAVTGGTASNGADYALAAGTLTFAPGATNAPLPFTLVNDDALENDETVEIGLSNPVNALVVAPAMLTCTILDNDGADTDTDGLTDSWENRIIAADTNDAIETIADVNPEDNFDSDPLSNEAEFIAGTDPADSNACFQLDVNLANGSVLVSFHAREASGTDYAGFSRYFELQERTLLTSGDWDAVASYTNIFATNQPVALTSSNTPGFFRARVWLERP
ncbi:MAG: metallophosphoesterase [Kiritimatiellae bacterium]|nr:metallophosphoesterase [Kiritimatiellia bacterium]